MILTIRQRAEKALKVREGYPGIHLSRDERVELYYTLFEMYFSDLLMSMKEEGVNFSIEPSTLGNPFFDAKCLLWRCGRGFHIYLRARKIQGIQHLLWKDHKRAKYHQHHPDTLAIMIFSRLIVSEGKAGIL